MHYSRNIQKLIEECIDFVVSRISLVSVKVLSEKYKIHPNLFCYYFRKITGKPFKRFVIEKKLEIAKYMLANTQKSISEIAKETGYSDVSNFNRFFRKFTGISPAEYRKKHSRKIKNGLL